MNRIVYLTFFVLVFVIALVFSLQNLDLVKVYFYRGGEKELSFEAPLALLLTLELLFGALIGYSVRMFRFIKLRAENVRLKRELDQYRSEVPPGA